MISPIRLITYTLFLLLSFSRNLCAQSIGGTTSGSTFFCDTTNSGFVSLNGYTGNILVWQVSTNNGTNWTNISNNTSTQSYNNLKLTSNYRAIVKNGSSLPDTSTISTIQVHLSGQLGPLTGGGNFCSNSGNGSLVLNSVNGTVLKWETTNTVNGIWTAISNTTSTLIYSNVTQTSYYRVIVQTFPACPYDTSEIASLTIDQNTVAGTILHNDTVCYGNNGDTLFLTGQTGNVTDWQRSDNGGINWTSTANISNKAFYDNITQPVHYKAIVKNGSCPTLTTSPVVIDVYQINPAHAGDDITITRHEGVSLKGNGNGSAEWSPAIYLDNKNSHTPTAEPLVTTTYILKITDDHACVAYDTMNINVVIPIPTAITPNNDDVNDYLLIEQIEAYPNNAIIIYNRWGNVVFKESPYTNNWAGKSMNGKDLPDDIYYIVLDYGTGDKPYNNYVLIKR